MNNCDTVLYCTHYTWVTYIHTHLDILYTNILTLTTIYFWIITVVIVISNVVTIVLIVVNNLR